MNHNPIPREGEQLPPLGAEALKPGVYRHFKGNLYRLLLVARHSETLQLMVVYQALYGDMGYWVRPAAMWTETVQHQGRQVARFEWQGEQA